MRDDLLRRLERDGFCVLDRYLGEKTVHDVTAAFEQLDSAPNGSEDPPSGVREKRGVRFARRNLLSIAFIQEFIAGQQVVSLLDRVCPGAVAVRAILFDKTGDANWTVPWHQDRSIAVAERIDVPRFGPWSQKAGVAHVQPPVEILKDMTTFRFSLDPCGPDNGPLRTIAATHRTILSASEVEEAVKAGCESICATEAGGVVIMRPLVLHASSPARSAGHRRVLHVEMGPPDLPGGLAWAKV